MIDNPSYPHKPIQSLASLCKALDIDQKSLLDISQNVEQYYKSPIIIEKKMEEHAEL